MSKRYESVPDSVLMRTNPNGGPGIVLSKELHMSVILYLDIKLLVFKVNHDFKISNLEQKRQP